ncbi:MAG TPA: ThiF family adenylyltransferase [Phycisphaerae bacterium]|nr:ThiF family adenylyltransferase [Phycisphaerae bacterium]
MNQSTNSELADRDLRQRDIIPPERLAACRATVVGVGAIGRQVALQLAAMGISALQLIDPDTVETVNLAPQGYLEDDLGRSKVSATADLCQQIHHRLETLEHQERFRRSMEIGNVLFCAVDSIETRRLIWQAVKDRVEFFGDGRMSAEVLRVLTVADAAGYRHYATTLFAAAEAYGGTCTAKSTIYCANIAAGLMVAQFAKFLRKLPVEADLQLNLLAAEWSVGAMSDRDGPSKVACRS